MPPHVVRSIFPQALYHILHHPWNPCAIELCHAARAPGRWRCERPAGGRPPGLVQGLLRGVMFWALGLPAALLWGMAVGPLVGIPRRSPRPFFRLLHEHLRPRRASIGGAYAPCPRGRQKVTGIAVGRRGAGVRGISLAHLKPPLTSYAPSRLYTGNAGEIGGTIPENIRVCACRKRGSPWEHGGSGWGQSSYWRCCS
jgi:hypothetical protein